MSESTKNKINLSSKLSNYVEKSKLAQSLDGKNEIKMKSIDKNINQSDLILNYNYNTISPSNKKENTRDDSNFNNDKYINQYGFFSSRLDKSGNTVNDGLESNIKNNLNMLKYDDIITNKSISNSLCGLRESVSETISPITTTRELNIKQNNINWKNYDFIEQTNNIFNNLTVYSKHMFKEILEQRFLEQKATISGILSKIKSDPILLSLSSASASIIFNTSQDHYNKLFDQENNSIKKRIEELIVTSLNSFNEKNFQNKYEDLTILKTKIHHYESQQSNFQNIINTLKEELEKNQEKIKTKDDIIKQLNLDNKKLNEQYSEYTNSLQLKLSEHQELYLEEIKSLENALNNERDKVQELTKSLNNFEQSKIGTTLATKQIEVELNRLNKIINVYEINLSDADDKLREKQSKLESLQQENNKEKTSNIEYTMKNKYLQEELISLKRTVEIQETKLKEINDINANLEDFYTSKTKEKLEASEKAIYDKYSAKIKEYELKIEELKGKLLNQEKDISYYKDQLQSSKNLINSNMTNMQEELLSLKNEWENKYFMLESQYNNNLSDSKKEYELDYIKKLQKLKQEKEDLYKEVSNLTIILNNYQNLEQNYIKKEDYEFEKKQFVEESNKKLNEEINKKQKTLEDELKVKLKQLESSKKEEYDFLIGNYKNNIQSLEKKISELETEKLNFGKSKEKLNDENLDLKKKIEFYENELVMLSKSLIQEKEISDAYLNDLKIIEKNFDEYITDASNDKHKVEKNIEILINDLQIAEKEILKLTSYNKELIFTQEKMHEAFIKEIEECNLEKDKCAEYFKQINSKILEDFNLVEINGIKLREENKNLLKKINEIEENNEKLDLKEIKIKEEFNKKEEMIKKLTDECSSKDNIIKDYLNTINNKQKIISKLTERLDHLKYNYDTISNSLKGISIEMETVKSRTKNEFKAYMNLYTSHISNIMNKAIEIIKNEKNLRKIQLNQQESKLINQKEEEIKKITEEINLNNDKYKKLQEELQSIKIEKNKVESMSTLNLNELNELKKEFERLKHEKEVHNTNHKQSLLELQNKLNDQFKEIDKLNSDKIVLDSKIKVLINENEELQTQIKKTKTFYADEQELISKEKQKLNSEKLESERKNLSLQIEIESVKNENTKLKNKYEEEKRNNDQFLSDKQESNQTIVRLKREISMLESNLNQIKEQVNKEKIETSSIQLELEKKEEQIFKLKKDYEEKLKIKERKIIDLQLVVDQSISKFDTKNLNMAEKLDEDIKLLMKKLKMEDYTD